MDDRSYCRSKAAPDGSAAYYTTLFFPPPTRDGLIAVHALAQELAEVVEDCSERSVAEHKLAYWQQELSQSLIGNATHPVTRALSACAGGALDAPLVADLLDGVHTRMTTSQIRDGTELERHCRRTAGALGRAAANLLAPGDSAAATAAEQAAAAAERVRLLRLPRRAGLPPHSGVPLDRLTACKVTPQEVDSASTARAAAELRRRLLADTRQALEDARATLSRRRGYAASRTAIALAELRALERGGYAGSGEGRPAMPAVLLWHAWRNRP